MVWKALVLESSRGVLQECIIKKGGEVPSKKIHVDLDLILVVFSTKNPLFPSFFFKKLTIFI